MYRDLGYNFLLGIDPYLDNADGINTRNADQIFEAGTVEFNYTSMDQLGPNQNMQSENFITGLQGWKIYGDGFAEFSGITLTGGLLHYNKVSFIDSTISGYYISPAGIYFGSAGDLTKLKFTISTGELEFVGKVSGRDSAIIASAINVNGEATGIIDYIVTNVKLGDLAVSAAKIQNLAVTELKIAAGAVTAAKTAVAAISSITGNLVANSVGETQIQDNAVISQKIIANAITAGKIDANAVTAVKILAGAVVSDKIFAGAVVADKIGVGAVTAIKIDTNAVTADKILAGAVTAGKIDALAINGMTITGATLQTDFPNFQSMVLNTNNLTGYDAGTPRGTSFKRMQLDYDSLEFYQVGGLRTMILNSAGLDFRDPATQNLKASLLYSSFSDSVIFNAPEGVNKGFSFNVRTTTTLYSAADLYYANGGTAVFSMGQTNSRIESNYFQAGSSGYVNFGGTGAGAYGFRMNSNVLEYYDSGSGGTWKTINSLGGGGLPVGVLLNHLYYTGSNWASTSTIYVGGSGGGTLTHSSLRIISSRDLVATGSLHATVNVHTGGIGDNDGAVYARILSTVNYNMEISTARNLYLRAGSAYSIFLGESGNYPTNVNLNFGNNVNFYQAGTTKCIIDENIWSAGGIQVGSYMTAGGTIQNSVGDIICSTGNVQMLKTGAVLAVKDAGGTTRFLTCKLNATTGTYILTT